ncbi:signal transduction histidine kinase [Thioploca ingrica]|uniref:histidine kinase n=1 Tax=Thioploca ingrica TaxID=40754 RepID=A0A090AI56_9GAMM|nr:signal transduction histidine kinase [Thioploca ingrica]
MLITGSFSIIQLQKLYEDSMEIILQKMPLQNATTEIKLTATTAHLWFEEIMTAKEETKALTAVWQLLDKSLWYADAIIKGGTREQDTFYPIHDKAIEGQIGTIKQDIEKFIDLAHLRFNNQVTAQENQAQALDDQFDHIFGRLIDNANQVQILLKTKIANDIRQLDEHVNTLKLILIVVNLLGIAIVIWISYSFIREIRYQVGGEPADIAHFAEQIAAGHFDFHFDTSKMTTGIWAAVQKMVKNLQVMSSKQEKQNWLQLGQTQLSNQMSGEQTTLQLAENILQFLTPYLDAQVGAFYLLQPLTEKKDYLKMIASYAYTWRNNSNYEFQIGEGIIGQVALERKVFVTHKVPANYLLIQSGLGESIPHALLVVPILYENSLKGVIELASFSAFTETHLELIKLTLPAIAIAINTGQSRTQTQELLEQSQLQAEELRSQQEELQQTNEQLQAQTEQLQVQQEELCQLNEQLEERGQELERERLAIQEKNVELEQVNLVIEAKVEELELTSQYKSEFLANISHELRTPLNSLLILSQVLTSNKEGNLTAEQLKYAQTIYSASSDLLNLINDILDLSKVEAGKMEIHLEPVALTQLITVLEDRFSLVAQEKGLKLVIQLADDLPPSLYTDEQRLIQILTNLLGNAFKFTAKGQVTLAIHRPAQATHLSKKNLDSFNSIAIDIIDTGIGIPTDKQQLIFEAFQQADGTTSRQYGGTGLGLSISRRLVHLLGGEIDLQSEAGKGSIFTVYLPEQLPTPSTLIESEPPPVITSPSFPTTPVVVAKPPQPVEDDRDNLQTGDKFLLIIEDDLTFAYLLMKTAHEKAFKCLVATEGQSGLQLAKKYQPQAIILDIGLPKIDGWSIMEQLKADSHTRPIPVHFISGADSEQMAKQRGAIGYCLKPVSMEGLYKVFNNIDHFITKTVKELLILSDDPNHQQALMEIVKSSDIRVTLAMTGREAYPMLQGYEFDCVVLDVSVEQDQGIHWLKQLYSELHLHQIPVIIYAERDLTTVEESILKTYLDKLIIKEVNSPEKLLDEVTLFLHQTESRLSQSQQQLLHQIHEQQNRLIGKQVLLVDDDMRNVFALAADLEKEGIETLVAHDGHSAIQQLQAKPDIAMVLMDMMMPEIDGYNAIRQIRAQPQFRQLPIIALIAKAMKADRTKCLEAGANDYLAKPINTHNLFSLLRVWLH